MTENQGEASLLLPKVETSGSDTTQTPYIATSSPRTFYIVASSTLRLSDLEQLNGLMTYDEHGILITEYFEEGLVDAVVVINLVNERLASFQERYLKRMNPHVHTVTFEDASTIIAHTWGDASKGTL